MTGARGSGFEERLLQNLQGLAESGALEARAPRRRIGPRLALVVAIVCLLAVAVACAAAVTDTFPFGDPRPDPNGALAVLLESPSGPPWYWRVYTTEENAPPGTTAVEIRSSRRTGPVGGYDLPDAIVRTSFDTSKAIWAVPLIGAVPLPNVVLGRVDRDRVDTLELRLGRASRPVDVQANGYFIEQVSNRDLGPLLAHKARLVARGSDGRVVATYAIPSL